MKQLFQSIMRRYAPLHARDMQYPKRARNIVNQGGTADLFVLDRVLSRAFLLRIISKEKSATIFALLKKLRQFNRKHPKGLMI